MIAPGLAAPDGDAAALVPAHVCFLTGEFPPVRGGVGDYTDCLARALARQSVRCSVVTGRGPQPRSAGRAPFAPEVYRAMPGWGWRALPYLRRLLDDLRPDILHIQYQTGAFGMHPAINLLPLARGALGRAIPIVVTCHDLNEPYLFPKAGRLRRFVNHLLLANADAVVVTNDEDLVQLVGDDVAGAAPWRWPGAGNDAGARAAARIGAGAGTTVDLIPIGSNIDSAPRSPERRQQTRARLGLGDNDCAIGFFGFLHEWKGVDTLVEAFDRLIEAERPVQLVFVGGATRPGAATSHDIAEAMRARIDGSRLRGRVVWTGFGDATEISEYLSALDICALPFRGGASFRHGSLIAAIAHGLPIVTTRRGRAFPDLSAAGLRPLVDGINARLVRPDDPAELAAVLDSLVASPAARAALADGARRLAPQFDWAGIARASRQLYARQLADRPLLAAALGSG